MPRDLYVRTLDRLAIFAVVVLLVVLLAGCASMQAEEKWAIGLAAADVATTAYALEHGAEELNPLLAAGNPSNEEIVLRAVVLNAAVHLLLRRMLSNPDRGHDRRGWRIVVGVRAVPVAWNTNQILELENP